MILSRFSFLIMAIMALSACGTLVDTPNQKIQVLTPGATGARCILQNLVTKYVVYPPQTVIVRRAQETLAVTCDAPGNRTKTIVIRSQINGDAMGNALNGGIGVAYDQISGALYQYPDLVEVDFTHMRAQPDGLPLYHAPDALSPFDQVPEGLENNTVLPPAQKSVPVPYKPNKRKVQEDKKSKSEIPQGHQGTSQPKNDPKKGIKTDPRT